MKFKTRMIVTFSALITAAFAVLMSLVYLTVSLGEIITAILPESNAAGATAPGACCGCSATPTGAITTSPAFPKTPWPPSAGPLKTATAQSWMFT